MTELITEEEIKKIKSNPVCVSETNLKILTPTLLKSGYMISYSIDELSYRKFDHISICNGNKQSDPAEEEFIIQKLLGKDYSCIGSFFDKDITHYIKEVKDV